MVEGIGNYSLGTGSGRLAFKGQSPEKTKRSLICIGLAFVQEEVSVNDHDNGYALHLLGFHTALSPTAG